MRHCDGRLFDGSACNNDIHDCETCGYTGCIGDGCDNQAYVAGVCGCGAALPDHVRTLAVSTAA